MQTSTACTLVPGDPDSVFCALRALVASTWGVGDDDVVIARPGRQLVHGVRLDGETRCWLDWELSAVGDMATEVRLAHDDADVEPGPPPDLDVVLGMLASAVRA